MELTFLGTNTLFITKDSSCLLIDPHFTRPGLLNLISKVGPDKARVEFGLRSAGIGHLDGVLLTHTHYDHAMDVPEVIHLVGGVLYGSESAANLAKGAGLPGYCYHVVKPYKAQKIGAFCVRWLPSQHISFLPPLSWFMPKSGNIDQMLSPPAYFWKYQCGAVYGLLIDDLLVFGSAGYDAGAYYWDCKVSHVVLPVGGLETKSGGYREALYRETVLESGAQQVFISHWDNFFQPLSPGGKPLGLAKRSISHLRGLGKRYGQAVKILAPFETIKL